MKNLKTLVMMQLRNKIDFSWAKTKMNIFRTLLFGFLKFAIITAITYVVLYLCQIIGIFYYSESPRIMILVVTFSLILSLISCTKDLMLNLYFAEDNRVLITFPVNSNIIFLSKLIVFYIYEIKRSLSFLIPITLGSVILLVSKGCASPFAFLWMWLPLLLIIAIPVLLGAILSIPTMYVYKFFKRYSILQVILFGSILTLVIIAIVKLINLIPEKIDLINQWPTIKKWLYQFLVNVEANLPPMRFLIRIIVGEQASIDADCVINIMTILKFGLLLVIDFALLAFVYLLARPLFFSIMAKNFEVNKSRQSHNKNVKHSKYFTFVNKELKINLRTISISINYLMVYIVVPILILLLNALYGAMDLKYLGEILIFTFNILIICLPLLASNALVATYYSREGKAGYLKKVKPIYALYPLFAKLFFNLILSIPTVFITVWIFGDSVGFNVWNIIILGFAILLLHYGHMIYSALLDVMNPQNEQYASTGVVNDNPNENKSTILAFILSFAYALIAFILFDESGVQHGSYLPACIRMLIISLVYCTSCVILFIKKIKAYYYEG